MVGLCGELVRLHRHVVLYLERGLLMEQLERVHVLSQVLRLLGWILRYEEPSSDLARLERFVRIALELSNRLLNERIEGVDLCALGRS